MKRAILTFALLLTGVDSAKADYIVTNLGSLGGGGNNTIAYGINSSGQVVGASNLNANTVTNAFLYGNGMMTNLGTLGGIGSIAYGINNSGQVVGQASLADNSVHAFIDSNGTMTDLNSLVPVGTEESRNC